MRKAIFVKFFLFDTYDLFYVKTSQIRFRRFLPILLSVSNLEMNGWNGLFAHAPRSKPTCRSRFTPFPRDAPRKKDSRFRLQPAVTSIAIFLQAHDSRGKSALAQREGKGCEKITRCIGARNRCDSGALHLHANNQARSHCLVNAYACVDVH